MVNAGCNLIFADHRPQNIVEEKMMFYRRLFPNKRFGLVYNSLTPLKLCDDLSDVAVSVVPENLPIPPGSYAAASLWLVPEVVRMAASDAFVHSPSLPLESDLEIARLDIDERIEQVLSIPSNTPYTPYALSCWEATPPIGQAWDGGNSNICDWHELAFDRPTPIAASTLGGMVFTGFGAHKIAQYLNRDYVCEYYDHMIDIAKQTIAGRMPITYASSYFTDYMFISSCKYMGLAIADQVNKVVPKYSHQAADVNTPTSVDDFEYMVGTNKYYVIHWLDMAVEKFSGSIMCCHKLRASLLEQAHQRGLKIQ